MLKIETETGSTYLYDESNQVVARTVSRHDLRRDGGWVRLLHPISHIEVGYGMTMVLEPLSEHATTTIRQTSKVVEVENI